MPHHCRPYLQLLTALIAVLQVAHAQTEPHLIPFDRDGESVRYHSEQSLSGATIVASAPNALNSNPGAFHPRPAPTSLVPIRPPTVRPHDAYQLPNNPAHVLGAQVASARDTIPVDATLDDARLQATSVQSTLGLPTTRSPFALVSSVVSDVVPQLEFQSDGKPDSAEQSSGIAQVQIAEVIEPADFQSNNIAHRVAAASDNSASVLSASSIYDPVPAVVPCTTGCGCGACQMNATTRLGRFAQGVYSSICCPDPCYTPTWTMLANASLFSEAVRPQSRQRFRWDYNDHFVQPDRAEYLWARSGALGPAPERSIDFHELSMITEIAINKFAFFIETPYRSTYLESGGHFAGFADLSIGTKTLLHDTRLMQFAFQFETHIPTSSPSKGLSSGHVSLEPALLGGIQLSEQSFIQMQLAQWIPIGGDPSHAGALLKHSMSYNRLLMGTANNTSLVGTLEYSAIHFQDGEFTDPLGNRHRASNEAVFQYGGGLRLNLCNKVNFGFGSLFSSDDWPATALRTEFQWLH